VTIKYLEFHVAQSGDPFIVHPDGWVRVVKNHDGLAIITFADGGSVKVTEKYVDVMEALQRMEE
jgi:hypothetical protein